MGLNASYGLGTSMWTSGAGAGSGTITVTSLDASRVEGTFAFTLVAFQGASPATRTITNGQFRFDF